jgi:hypothetical protein
LSSQVMSFMMKRLHPHGSCNLEIFPGCVSPLTNIFIFS